ncbi:MAG TPA: pantoate--beta-alanine ligase [Burkholderiales bacterium]|nr:pantoate--beta-alanine ligase [Burkholderiales bacterium]
MEVIRTVEALRHHLRGVNPVACVPTMGNIHEGHLSLVRIAKKHAPTVVTTIFVNRLQFGANEDFDSYPRTFEDDCKALEGVGNSIVFHPDEQQMYPEPQVFTVEPPVIANKLEGRFRLGHFRGVSTVVLKLFNMVQPQFAVFGKKDYQQLAIIRHMVDQLALPVKIIPAETVRADDGLALSSRNRYLSAQERIEAPRLQNVLQQVKRQVESGDRNFEAIEFAADAELARHGWHVDYVVVRSRRTLMQPAADERELVVLGAAKLGATRLIDNLEITAPS